MKMRFARGISIAIVAGMVLAGSAALASGATPAASVKWTSGKTAPFAGTRFDGAAVGGKVYFLGFRVLDNSTDGSIWTYNIKQKQYADTGDDMAVPVSNYTVAVLKDRTGTGLYIFGGRDNDGASVKTVQVYYPASGKTAVIKDDKWPGTTPSDCISLPATGVAVAGNKAYVMGGMSFSTSVPACVDDQSKQTWIFDPMGRAGNRWKAGPNLKTARGYISPAVVGGDTIYAIGGDINDAGTLVAQPAVESWKIGSNSWSSEANLPKVNGIAGCDESQAFAFNKGPLGGTITLAGCGQWPMALPDVLQLHVNTGNWSNIGTLLEARRNHAGVNIGSVKNPKLMVLGGYNSDGSVVLDTSELGTPGRFGNTRGAAAHVSPTRSWTPAF